MSEDQRSRVLLVKLGDLGDTVLLTAAVDAAVRYLPGFDLHLLIGEAGAPIFARDPRIRRVWSFDRRRIEGRRAFSPRSIYLWGRLLWYLRRERYSAIVLAHHLTTVLGTLKLASIALASGASIRVGLDNGRGRFLTHAERDGGFGRRCEGAYWVRLIGSLAWARKCDTSCDQIDGRLSIHIEAGAETHAAKLLRGAERPLVAVHHGLGGWIPSRAWRPEGYARVIETVQERFGGTILLIGGPEERHAASEIASLTSTPVRVLAGETDVSALMAVLSRCDLYVGPDSGPMHLAEALGTPVVSLWGPTNERAWGPCPEIGSSPAITVRAADRPRPTLYVGHAMGDVRRAADLGSLDAARVADAATELLERTGSVRKG